MSAAPSLSRLRGSRVVSGTTRNLRARATLPNADEILRPGMFATVNVQLPEERDVIVLPATAIVYSPYGDSVYVVGKDDKGVLAAQQRFALGLPLAGRGLGIAADQPAHRPRHASAFDEIGACADLVHAKGGWVHVDGAFGLWAAASPRQRYLVDGLDRADSWATDAHKTLNVPFDCGVAIVRDPAAVKAAMGMHGDYLILYTVATPGHLVHLLSIRHHRELSFQFSRLWAGPTGHRER